MHISGMSEQFSARAQYQNTMKAKFDCPMEILKIFKRCKIEFCYKDIRKPSKLDNIMPGSAQGE
jgi:hypothetical protein